MSAVTQVLALPGFWRLEKVPPSAQAFYGANTKPKWVAVVEDPDGNVADGVGSTMEEACADLLANHTPPIDVAKEPSLIDEFNRVRFLERDACIQELSDVRFDYTDNVPPNPKALAALDEALSKLRGEDGWR